MKKTLIAVAVAATAAAPAAFADITMGGQLQAEVVSVSNDAGMGEGIFLTDAWGGKTSNSGPAAAFFIKGAHDLGNGLTGIYKLNTLPRWATGTTTAQKTLTARDAFVGLKGGFGTVLLGRMNKPYKTATVKWDPFLGTFLQARGSSGMSKGHNSYIESAVGYANKFGPAKVAALVSFDEANSDDANHTLSASLNVPIGPIELAAAYLGKDGNAATKVGAKFSTGAITIAAQYEMIDGGSPNVGGLTADTDIGYVTGSFKAGKNTFSASFGQTDSGGADSDYFAIGAKRALGKKVSVHAGATVNGTDNDQTTLFGTGMRVKF